MNTTTAPAAPFTFNGQHPAKATETGPQAVTIRVNRNAKAVHISSLRADGAVNFPLCGAPGNTPAAFRAFRPVVVDEAVTCKRCAK